MQIPNSEPRVSNFSDVLGTQKAIVQRLLALIRTTNSLRVQVSGCYPKSADDQTGIKPDNLLTAVCATQHDMYKLIEELECDLSAISEHLGDAYNPDALVAESAG